MVVALHNAGSLYSQLAHSVGYLAAVFVNYFDLPAVARNADSAYLVNISDTKVNAAGSYRLAESVVGVVLVIRENSSPALDKRGRNGLSADVHQSPAAQVVAREVDISSVYRVKDILRPRNEQPDD